MDSSLRFAPFRMTNRKCHSERKQGIHYGFFTPLRSVQNDESESVIPSASEESTMDSSLRFAPFRMTKAKA
jgi:hypothetical protein